MPKVESARLTYRGIKKSDPDDMLDIYNDYDTQLGAMADGALPRAEAFRDEMERWSKMALFSIVIEEGTCKWVSFVFLRIQQPKDREGAVAMMLKRKFWGKGYGTEVMRWLIDQGFKTLALHRVALDVVGSNARAIATYLREDGS